MNNYSKHKLSDLVLSANTGLDAIKRAPIVAYDSGIKCLRIQDISQGNEFSNWGFCEVSDENYKRFSLNEDEIIVARTGNTIGVNIFIDKNLKSVFNNGLIRLRVNEQKCVSKYLYYNMQTTAYWSHIDSIAFGTSTQPNMQIATFLSYEIPLPDLTTQTRIANLLSSLDDKIELNRRMNQTLEQIAATLFKKYFVNDIDPDNLPEGWRVSKVSDLFNITIGRTPPRKESQWFTTNINDVKWISIKDMGNSGVYISQTSESLTEEAVKKFNIPRIPPHTVVLSFKLTVGRVAITTEEMLSNEAIAHFIPKSDTFLSTYFTYLYLKDFEYNSLGNTSSIATAVNSQTIKDMKLLIPSREIVNTFSNAVSSLFKKIKNNQKEVVTLTNIRDTLLPRLMSGEIDLTTIQQNEQQHAEVLS